APIRRRLADVGDRDRHPVPGRGIRGLRGGLLPPLPPPGAADAAATLAGTVSTSLTATMRTRLLARAEARVEARRDPMDEDAFRAFYERTSRPLWAYLARCSGDRQLADDLLQEAYYRLLRTSGNYADEAHRRN